MYEATIYDGNTETTFLFNAPIKLSDILTKANIEFSMPCAGNHTCGKCFVEAEGSLLPPSSEETALIKRNFSENNPKLRLACFAIASGNLTIRFIHKETKDAKILSYSPVPDIKRNKTGIGISCDIGTTTVVSRLYHLTTGEVLSEEMSQNRQRAFGADVISRITKCNEEGVEVLSRVITEQLKEMFLSCVQKAEDKIGRKICPDFGVITGNTTMLHILTKKDPKTLALYPFTPLSLFGETFHFKDLSFPVYLPPCISAYVGADITCAVLASGMMNKKETSLLVDIGTNGEMALFSDGTLYCCSTAAGPAFEGAGISMGMNAAAGAINSVYLKYGICRYTTIGEKPPIGICGSGIIDAVSTMKRLKLLDESGYIENNFVIGDSQIAITQKDIRQIQLAKAAVCAGALTLIHEAGLLPADIDRLYIAGGFGHYLNYESVGNIGLLPKALLKNVTFLGNAALSGATMILLNSEYKEKTAAIKDAAVEISLSASSYFMDEYMEQMEF
jgi:uncharacterized 2Fe-2S/4Fe-4S cluster protein (DUF4445 family)